MFKIGYFGDGPWASLALEHIAAQPEAFSVAFITPRFDTQDPELKRWAEKLGVPFLPHENVNSDDFRARIAEFECDVLVSMSFNQILKHEIIHLPPKGFINCHAGALPFYRGRNPLNWALINGEENFGVTVHYVDEGIDTGDIIRQSMVPIGPDENYGDLLQKAHGACAETLLAALGDIAFDKVKRIRQTDIHPVGFYCGRRRAGDENLNWDQGAQEVHNFVRAVALPGPGARVMTPDGEAAILRTHLIEHAPDYKAAVGEIVGRWDAGVVVKVADSTVLVTRAAMIDKTGMPGEAFIPRWPIGMRFEAVKPL